MKENEEKPKERRKKETGQVQNRTERERKW